MRIGKAGVSVTILSGNLSQLPDKANIKEGFLFHALDTASIWRMVGGVWTLQAIGDPWTIPNASLADFQLTPATGTATEPARVNDTLLVASCTATLDEYAEIAFGKWVAIDQWRLYGSAGNNLDGVWKLEYYGQDGVWHDWVTGIPTNDGTWTGLSVETEVICDKVRITCTTADSSGSSKVVELEIYHT